MRPELDIPAEVLTQPTTVGEDWSKYPTAQSFGCHEDDRDTVFYATATYRGVQENVAIVVNASKEDDHVCVWFFTYEQDTPLIRAIQNTPIGDFCYQMSIGYKFPSRDEAVAFLSSLKGTIDLEPLLQTGWTVQ